jgi:glycosyltransferase involved in cell wall biosynthesis
MPLKNKTILIISPESWGTSFVSKHHYATLLSQTNNRVFFLNPPSEKNEIKSINENLQVIDYQINMRGANRLPAFLRNMLNARQISKIRNQFLPEPLDIVWSFDPYRFQNLKAWKAKTAIYHPVDVHHTDLEFAIAATADIIFSTANLILQKFENSLPKVPKYQINHGLAAHFLQENIQPATLPKDYKTKVGYVGNLNYPYLDTSILIEIIKNNPEVGFFFIGPYTKSNLSGEQQIEFIATLQQLPNVHLLGAKPSAELPNYLAAFDLFLMSYAADKYRSELANPHKILEYFSTGKCVVAHYIDEYKAKPALVSMAKTNAELPALFAQTVANIEQYNAPKYQDLRRQYARDNTYTAQLARIEQYLDAIS